MNRWGAPVFVERPNDVGDLVRQVDALSEQLRLETARGLQLSAGLATRDHIGQAKGILMERYKIDEGGAFMMLIQESNRRNIKLHDIALELARTGHMKTAAD